MIIPSNFVLLTYCCFEWCIFRTKWPPSFTYFLCFGTVNHMYIHIFKIPNRINFQSYYYYISEENWGKELNLFFPNSKIWVSTKYFMFNVHVKYSLLLAFFSKLCFFFFILRLTIVCIYHNNCVWSYVGSELPWVCSA